MNASVESFTDRLNKSPKYTGWYTISTRSRMEDRVTHWINQQLTELHGVGVEDCMTPKYQVNGESHASNIVFIKTQYMEIIRERFSQQQLAKNGIIRIYQATDLQVYNTMSSSGISDDSLKEGDLVTLKDQPYALTYTVVAVEDTKVKVSINLFECTDISEYDIDELVKCSNK